MFDAQSAWSRQTSTLEPSLKWGFGQNQATIATRYRRHDSAAITPRRAEILELEALISQKPVRFRWGFNSMAEVISQATPEGRLGRYRQRRMSPHFIPAPRLPPLFGDKLTSPSVSFPISVSAEFSFLHPFWRIGCKNEKPRQQGGGKRTGRFWRRTWKSGRQPKSSRLNSCRNSKSRKASSTRAGLHPKPRCS